MKDKTYLVLTPEKIEDIFRDLEQSILNKIFLDLYRKEEIYNVLNEKKKELLKSIK